MWKKGASRLAGVSKQELGVKIPERSEASQTADSHNRREPIRGASEARPVELYGPQNSIPLIARSGAGDVGAGGALDKNVVFLRDHAVEVGAGVEASAAQADAT